MGFPGRLLTEGEYVVVTTRRFVPRAGVLSPVQTRVADHVQRQRHEDAALQEWMPAPLEHAGEDGARGIRVDHRS